MHPFLSFFSQTVEESPSSDLKMDISSDATMSQESSGISVASPEEGQTDCKYPPTNIHINEINHQHNENGPIQQIDLQMNTLEMNNKDENASQIHWHPLMPQVSPTDSEKSPYFNYPDVIPVSELSNRPLRLSNPLPIDNQLHENISNGNVPTTTTTTTSKSPKSKLKLDTLKVGHHKATNKLKKKISVLNDPGQDFNDSSDSEEISQYQATVGPSYNSVALSSNRQAHHNKHSISPSLNVNRRRKIPLSVTLMSDEISAAEDSDTPPLSPSSSIFDEMGYNYNQNADDSDPATPKSVQIPQYTARDEARDSRNWQKITLPDGKTREIDMKVIEPYKRILSHGGYLKSGGNNAIILFSTCHLPDKSRTDYHYVMDNLFFYVVKTLEQLVTEDYILIYLHGGASRSNVPPFPWLKK
jgi:prune homolog 2